MKKIGILLLTSFVIIAVTGCCSKDEVLRVTAPDKSTEAVLIETNCGANVSFGYKVYVTPRGASTWRGKEVANLYGAVRNNGAYGVNLRWLSADSLSIEYLKAQDERLEKPTVNVSGRDILISLKSGIEDQTAPEGGMLWNLQKRKT